MSEIDNIPNDSSRLNTIKTLMNDLERLGIESGMTLIVHSSLKSIGWVCGGAVSVILALENVLTENGTLIMPTHSTDLSEPKYWENPPVPESWWEIIRKEMPPFDKNLTPTTGMGTIPEVFRKQENVVRSTHPNTSFCAWGKQKEYIIQDNHLDFQLNDKSPLGRIYELNGYILLLGVGYDSNTSLHLSEYLANYKSKRIKKEYAPVSEHGIRIWKEYEDININSDDFVQIGMDFEKEHNINVGKIGNAESRLISQRELVNYAKEWMRINRK